MLDDPELVQARNFLDDLRRHARTLTRRLQSVPAAAAVPHSRTVEAELAAVHDQINLLYRRFPALQDPAPAPAG